MRDVEIGALVEVLRRLFGLPEDADATLAARVKHMQRLGFPSAGTVGQGHRRAYGMRDILRLTLAFQVVDAGLASALAVRLVEAHWGALGALLARAAAGEPRVPLAAVAPNVIVEVSKTAAKRWRGGECVVFARSARPPSRPRGSVPSPSLIVDAAHLVGEVARALRALRGIAGDEVAEALLAFSREARDGEDQPV